MNEALVGQINALTSLLSDALSSNPTIDITSLKTSLPTESILANRPDLTLGLPPTRDSAYVPPLDFFASLVPGARAKHARLLAAANAEGDEIYVLEMKNHELLRQRRSDALNAAIAETEALNRQIDEFFDALRSSDPEAIKHYFATVLDCSEYPSGFPKKCKLAYVPESRQLVADYQMPTIDEIVTKVEKYRYVKASGTVSETKKPERTRQQLYARPPFHQQYCALCMKFSYLTLTIAWMSWQLTRLLTLSIVVPVKGYSRIFCQRVPHGTNSKGLTLVTLILRPA